MRKAAVFFSFAKRTFSSEPDIQTLYSFLQPSIFSLKKTTPTDPPNPQNTPASISQPRLEAILRESLLKNNTDEAWKSFKSLTAATSFLSKPLTNALITHLSSLSDTHSLKRAFASAVFVLEKNPSLLEYETLKTLLGSMRSADAVAPALALVKIMLKNRFFMPFELWGSVLVDMCRTKGSFAGFSSVFDECCRIVLDDKVGFMKPDLVACNAALEFYCRESESVVDADKVLEKMSLLAIRPDAASFGLLAYLYAVQGMSEKVVELEGLLVKFGISDKSDYFHNVVCGYLKLGKFDSVVATILCGLKEGQWFSLETCSEVVKGFFQNENYKPLADVIIESQKIEPSSILADRSFGYGVITACVSLGFLDKAHSILYEMNVQGASIGLGPYIPILKAYCKHQRTSEAAQLVSEIRTLGLNPDASTYDALIESSMLSQDFHSAFSLFRDMRGSRADDLKTSYLTIITGLTEHHRPELMAAFLDEIVEDPRIEIGTHDWNSIIHAFCKAGRLEDARRTFRRMSFLNYEPNGQTYLSMINGYVALEKYFSVLMLWNEVRRKISIGGEGQFVLDTSLVDAFLYALVKGGFFDAVMQVVEKSREMKIFVDKWRYKQAFMEKHRKLKVSKLRKRSFRKMESLVAFKNWAGLSG